MVIDWNSSALWGIIGVVAGILVSSFFYFIGQKRKSIIYYVTTVTLISNNVSKLNDLNIKYKNKSINELHVSTIEIKNSGNSIIEPKDFASSFPLTITTTGEFFIDLNNNTDTTQLFTQNKYSKVYFQIKPTENNILKELIIQFDYIPKKSDIVCEVFHTGALSITGKLKEGKIICSDTLSRTYLSSSISGMTEVFINNTIKYVRSSLNDILKKDQ